MKNLLMAMVVLVLVAGCAVARASAVDLNGTSWTLTRLGDASLVPDTEVTLHFEDGALGGNASCNAYGGSFTLDGAQIAMSEIFSTMMYCYPEEVMEQEMAYLAALCAATTFQVEGDALSLFDAEGVRVAEFVAAAK